MHQTTSLTDRVQGGKNNHRPMLLFCFSLCNPFPSFLPSFPSLPSHSLPFSPIPFLSLSFPSFPPLPLPTTWPIDETPLPMSQMSILSCLPFACMFGLDLEGPEMLNHSGPMSPRM